MARLRSLLAGTIAAVLAGVGTVLLADWPTLAVANAVACGLGFGLLSHVYPSLRAHVDGRTDVGASLWSAGFGAVVGLAMTAVVTILELPTWEVAAVAVLVAGTATATFAVGIGMTLAYLEDSGGIDAGVEAPDRPAPGPSAEGP